MKRSFARAVAAFTLIEVAFVILLILLISAVVVGGGFDFVFAWRQKGSVQKFLNTWELAFQEAAARRSSYRLVIDIANNSYYLRREVIATGDLGRHADYLERARSRRRTRRDMRREREISRRSLAEEYQEDEERQSGLLENNFYAFVFADPDAPVEIATPLEFPSLAEPVELAGGVFFKSVKTPRGEERDGEPFIRFLPLGAAEFAVVKLDINGETFSAFMNPGSGQLSLEQGDLNFETIWNSDNSAD